VSTEIRACQKILGSRSLLEESVDLGKAAERVYPEFMQCFMYGNPGAVHLSSWFSCRFSRQRSQSGMGSSMNCV
jgi:hypothetical protein